MKNQFLTTVIFAQFTVGQQKTMFTIKFSLAEKQPLGLFSKR